MNHPKTKLLLISGLGLIFAATRSRLDIGAYAFCGGLGTSLFLTSYGYLLTNSDQNEPKKLKIKNIEKVCNVYEDQYGRPYVRLIEIDIISENGKSYAYKNNRYLGRIHHFTSTLHNERSQAIYTKDGYVFIEGGYP